jgi:hypothetical protein
MSPGFVPHQAKPQPPSVHSVNPSTAGRHVDVVAETDESWFPLEALCADCGQITTAPSRDAAWIHKELTLPAQRNG